MIPREDIERMRAIQGGDAAAFEAFVRENERRFFRVAVGYLTDADEALDAAQEAFVKVWQKRGTWKPESKPVTWAHRILANHCIDRLRRRRVRSGPSLEEMEEASGSLPADPTAVDPFSATRRGEERAVINKAVQRLPERMRLTVLMRFGQDLQLHEIATLQGRSIGTVKATLHRAMKKLRADLGGGHESVAEGC